MLAETNHGISKSFTVTLQPDLITPRYLYITFTHTVHVHFCMCIESIQSMEVFTHAPYCTILEVLKYLQIIYIINMCIVFLLNYKDIFEPLLKKRKEKY